MRVHNEATVGALIRWRAKASSGEVAVTREHLRDLCGQQLDWQALDGWRGPREETATTWGGRTRGRAADCALRRPANGGTCRMQKERVSGCHLWLYRPIEGGILLLLYEVPSTVQYIFNSTNMEMHMNWTIVGPSALHTVRSAHPVWRRAQSRCRSRRPGSVSRG